MKGTDLNLGAQAIEMQGIEPYNACLERPCMNRGRCEAANTRYGYRCICTEGFTGYQCQTPGQRCYPGELYHYIGGAVRLPTRATAIGASVPRALPATSVRRPDRGATLVSDTQKS